MIAFELLGCCNKVSSKTSLLDVLVCIETLLDPRGDLHQFGNTQDRHHSGQPRSTSSPQDTHIIYKLGQTFSSQASHDFTCSRDDRASVYRHI